MSKAEIRPSHCLEALMALKQVEKEGYTLEDSHYTAEGVEATLVDELDGQRYLLTIQPIWRG